MKKLQVIRTHLSPYQGENFMAREKALLERLPGVEYCLLAERTSNQETVLITNTHTVLHELPQDLLQSTKLIIHPNSGYDHFIADYELCRSIPLVIGHEIRAQAVAEYSLSCLFYGATQLPQHHQWDKERRWSRQLLGGETVFVFGYGHIGKIVADTLATLGVKVTVVDPYLSLCPHPLLKSWEEGELSAARAVLVCCGLNRSSRLMFNQDFFTHVRDDLIFINGARGALVNENDLREFLLTHPSAQAFLDVFEKEPFGQEWENIPRVWKTSHIAGVHQDLDQGILDFSLKVLDHFLTIEEKEFKSLYRQELLENKWIQGELI